MREVAYEQGRESLGGGDKNGERGVKMGLSYYVDHTGVILNERGINVDIIKDSKEILLET